MRMTGDLHAFLWRDFTSNNSNTYFINGSKNILIDPGHFHHFGNVKDHLAALSLTPEDVDLVILTHAHPDHAEAVRDFLSSKTLVALHHAELAFVKDLAPQYGAAMGLPEAEPQILLKEGQLRVGDTKLQILHVPGHSPGSIAIYWEREKALFTGDVIFSQGIGRTDLPGGDGRALKKSIKTLARLEVEHLLPGHGETVSGSTLVRRNFSDLERVWFQYI